MVAFCIPLAFQMAEVLGYIVWRGICGRRLMFSRKEKARPLRGGMV